MMFNATFKHRGKPMVDHTQCSSLQFPAASGEYDRLEHDHPSVMDDDLHVHLQHLQKRKSWTIIGVLRSIGISTRK
jgi:hypothetical protein